MNVEIKCEAISASTFYFAISNCQPRIYNGNMRIHMSFRCFIIVKYSKTFSQILFTFVFFHNIQRNSMSFTNLQCYLPTIRCTGHIIVKIDQQKLKLLVGHHGMGEKPSLCSKVFFKILNLICVTHLYWCLVQLECLFQALTNYFNMENKSKYVPYIFMEWEHIQVREGVKLITRLLGDMSPILWPLPSVPSVQVGDKKILKSIFLKKFTCR